MNNWHIAAIAAALIIASSAAAVVNAYIENYNKKGGHVHGKNRNN